MWPVNTIEYLPVKFNSYLQDRAALFVNGYSGFNGIKSLLTNNPLPNATIIPSNRCEDN
jgi:hypothetical protein